MDKGNSVAIPAPINEAPGLNAMFVFGENMQAALGLNHQVAFGNNQQICINPAGLLADVDVEGGPLLTGLLGGDAGGNMQLSFGCNVALTVGQAFEMNLGPDKIQIDGGLGSHKCALVSCTIIGTLVSLYALAYGLVCASQDYAKGGTYTLIYQEAVNACLGFLMLSEKLTKEVSIVIDTTVLTAFGVQQPPSSPSESPKSGAWPAFGTGLALGAAIEVPLLATLLDGNREIQEEQDQNTQNNQS